MQLYYTVLVAINILQFPLVFSAQCPVGWQLSVVDTTKCYLLVTNKATWSEAEQHCRQAASHLTSVTSAFETSNLNSLVQNSLLIGPLDQVWIGASGINQDDRFVWTDGTPMSYTNWRIGEPYLLFSCVSSAAGSTAKWSTENCQTKNAFICEHYMVPTDRPTDCFDLQYRNGITTSGIYQIYPPGIAPFMAYCDMETDGGGWTVFQRRIDNTTTFYDKLWNDYKVGFNNGLDKNLWLGNDNIHILSTKDSDVELRVDFWGQRNPDFSPDPHGYWWEKRTDFHIGDEAHFYDLHLSRSYTGNATYSPGAGIRSSVDCKFSTADKMNDADPTCFSEDQLGGWWMFQMCSNSALNGKYVPPPAGYGFFWNGGPFVMNPLQSRMMLRTLVW
uniref:Uncharacterized protein n=1 Tax=Plectus sambesii TaxID=2011161 RepID=A0A914WC03_9BILA